MILDAEAIGDTDSHPYRIRNIIRKNNFSSKFMEILKDLDDGTIGKMPYENRRYYINSEFLTKPDKSVSKARQLNLKTFDLMQFLLYAYNEYDGGLNNNYCFLGPLSGYHDTTYTDSTMFRFADNQNALKVINDVIDLKEEYFNEIIKNVKLPYMSINQVNDLSETILDSIMSPVEKYSEVIGYKIEKFGSQPTGDSATQDLIQKFWIFNDEQAPEDITVTDTQVKYGQDYTYKGYAYVAVMSHKYKYSDFRLTKQIATYDTNGDGNIDKYCMQFYDPMTDELAEQLLFNVDSAIFHEKSVLATAEDGANTFATNGQELSEHPQLADFYLNVEPCAKNN
jgi:hypothetical protein